MGTGFGGVPFGEAARQMAVAYRHYREPPHRLDWDFVVERQRRSATTVAGRWHGDPCAATSTRRAAPPANQELAHRPAVVSRERRHCLWYAVSSRPSSLRSWASWKPQSQSRRCPLLLSRLAGRSARPGTVAGAAGPAGPVRFHLAGPQQVDSRQRSVFTANLRRLATRPPTRRRGPRSGPALPSDPAGVPAPPAGTGPGAGGSAEAGAPPGPRGRRCDAGAVVGEAGG